MKYLPCKELTKVLLPAYTKCCILKTNCTELRFDLTLGHFPRGFCGAFGSLADVKLVLVLAEPGTPNPIDHGVPLKTPPHNLLEDNTVGVFDVIKENKGTRNFHGNVGIILDECWPGLSLEEQFARTWMTESVLCSAKSAVAQIPRTIELACGETYLRRQLDLLPNAFVVALGGKARSRMDMIGANYHATAWAPGKPKGLTKEALKTWKELGKAFRKYLKKNG